MEEQRLQAGSDLQKRIHQVRSSIMQKRRQSLFSNDLTNITERDSDIRVSPADSQELPTPSEFSSAEEDLPKMGKPIGLSKKFSENVHAFKHRIKGHVEQAAREESAKRELQRHFEYFMAHHQQPCLLRCSPREPQIALDVLSSETPKFRVEARQSLITQKRNYFTSVLES